jgi:hypothetical protein
VILLCTGGEYLDRARQIEKNRAAAIRVCHAGA